VDRLGVRCSAERFIPMISNLYHAAESEHYDQVHRELDDAADAWLSCFDAIGHELPRPLRVLDVGAGTGFASALVLDSLGPRIRHLVCLDPSAAMLAKAQARLANRPTKIDFVVGDVDCLEATQPRFDLILTNSVLHHVPDVPHFLSRIRTLLTDGGIYVAGHEPCREFFSHVELRRWTAIYRRWRRVRHFLDPRAYLRRLRPAASDPSITETVNHALLEQGVIAQPLSTEDIRALIDIHVPSTAAPTPDWALPGLSQDEMLAEGLRGCVSRFTTSYSHIKDARVKMGPGWRAVDRWLRRRFPMHGANFLLAVRRGSTSSARSRSGHEVLQPCT
jgi:ubiquinone/menaquinone biosynthesis C-methylase UbiE